MFLGTSVHRLDDKGRLSLPVHIRKHVQGSLALIRSEDGCIVAYQTEDLRAAITDQQTNPLDDASARMRRRRLLTQGSVQDIDAQGRITLSTDLRDTAGIVKECLVNGQLDYFEIWDKVTGSDVLGIEETA